MLTIALILLTSVTIKARAFNITHLIIPEVVPPGLEEVVVECRYDANFTLLSWFRGPTEFFRYKPGAAPSTRSFPILGVGKIELIACGPTACRLKLGGLTEEASGLYRCDIERDIPPHLFETRAKHMEVHGHEHRRPLLQGLAPEYGEGDEMQAYCRGASDAELRWYINGREIEELRGSAVFKRTSSRLIYGGVPPTVTVQCAEFRLGRLLGSNHEKARWKDLTGHKDEVPQEQRSASVMLKMHLGVLYSLLSLYLFID